jgi:hypothetical protein
MATNGVHPKWISCFPGSVHRWDDGAPEPEEDFYWLGRYVLADDVLFNPPPPQEEEKSLDQILREMGV